MLVNPKFVEMNCFKRVHCSKGSDLFARVGKREPLVPLPSSEDFVPLHQSKLDMLESLKDFDSQLERDFLDSLSSKSESLESTEEQTTT